MATSSFFHSVVINSPDEAKQLIEALEEAERLAMTEKEKNGEKLRETLAKEAKEILENIIDISSANERNEIEIDALYEDAIKQAIKALEKQIPKKAKIIDVCITVNDWECPICGARMVQDEPYDNYCPNCGQRLKWD